MSSPDKAHRHPPQHRKGTDGGFQDDAMAKKAAAARRAFFAQKEPPSKKPRTPLEDRMQSGGS
jgi:hypothetical protein